MMADLDSRNMYQNAAPTVRIVCVVLIVAAVSGFLLCTTRCTGVEFLIVVSFVSALQCLTVASLLANGGRMFLTKWKR